MSSRIYLRSIVLAVLMSSNFPSLSPNSLYFRHYDDKPAEAAQGFWNCPCVPMRERYVYLEVLLHAKEYPFFDLILMSLM